MKHFIGMVAISVFLGLSQMASATGATYQLNASSTAGGEIQVMITVGDTITTYGSGVSLTLPQGTRVLLSASANAGWHFAYWSGNAGFSDSSIEISMTQDWSLLACFEKDQPTLTISSGAGGTVLLPGIGSFMFASRALVTIQAEAHNGYEFASWTGTAVDAGKVADPTAAGTFVTVDSDYTLQANFTARAHTLTVTSGSGGTVILPGIGTFHYVDGAVATLSAHADDGYHFVSWSGSAVDALKVADPTAATTTITMDDSYSVSANFATDQHTLTVTWTTGGAVQTTTTVNGVKTTWTDQTPHLLDDGVMVQLVAVPNSGWHFTQWSGAPESTAATLSFTITQDRTITASFAQDSRTLTVTAGEGGTVTQPGIGSFRYQTGTVVALEAMANSGYRFANWTGTLVDANAVADPRCSVTTATLTLDGTLQANFETVPQDFKETWQTASPGMFTPSASTYISSDEGFWAVQDAYTCGDTPQRAAVLVSDRDQALMLTSKDSGASCSDRVSAVLSMSNSASLWEGVSIATDTVLSFDEVGQLCNPGLHDGKIDGSSLPSYDNISLILTDNNGNVLVYVLQRYSGASANLGCESVTNTYREIFLDAEAVKYQRNLYADFATIPSFKPAGAYVTSIEFRVDQHGSAIIDNITIGSGTVIDKVAVHRYWSPSKADHFYTCSTAERASLTGAGSDWVYEGIAYFGVPSGAEPSALPVYRFWSDSVQSHFYTISEGEKNKLVKQSPAVWQLEGAYFYAFNAANHPADTVPVYRFWSGVIGDHFYTTSEPERDKVISINPQIWIFEGVAWYAYAPWEFALALTTTACN